MNEFYNNEGHFWRNTVTRTLLVIVTVAIIVWVMPREQGQRFRYDVGKPWMYGSFIAKFDFPIYKTDEAIKEEEDSLMENYQPYYNYKPDVEQQQVKRFVHDYKDGLPGLPYQYVPIVVDHLHRLYQAGIMNTPDYNSVYKDSTSTIRIVTERWEVNDKRNPSRWIFDKGLFLEQFDEKFHVQSYIQCDTAYYFDQKKLWELRSRVRVLTKDGLKFSSERLYWDEDKHELYSDVYSRLVTPERTLEGSYFRSDERMTKYFVSNSKGSFERSDFSSDRDTITSAPDTVKAKVRPQTMPQRKSNAPTH